MNEQARSRTRWRPRFSILSALLAMTIVGLAIVTTRLWREVGPLRQELRRLRDEVGELSVDDATKIHAMEVRTNDPLMWKFRVWVPAGQKAVAKARWGDVPRVGFPQPKSSVYLNPGEQWVTYCVKHSPSLDSWSVALESATGGSAETIQKNDRWWRWPESAGVWGEGVQNTTGVFKDDQDALVLKRWRVADTKNSDDFKKMQTTAGFMIWVERR